MVRTELEEATREATYPSAYPTGWYHVFDSDDLAPGQVAPLFALGKHLVVFRTADSGRVSVLDAHCPHMGANLAAGGRVRGECLHCPFHDWAFSAAGQLQSVPGLSKIPKARVPAYPVREHYGMIWMYHDVSGKPTEPPYEPQRHADIDDGRMVFRGTYNPSDVKMHICEFIENSVDFQHFAVLHSELTIPWTQIRVPAIRAVHHADWAIDPAREHVSYFTDQAHLTFLGRDIPRSDASAEVTLFGPGSTVWFRFNIPNRGNILLFQTHLPTAPLNQQVRFRYYADAEMPRALVWYVVGHWISQWRADVEIWENKVMRRRPVLVPIDGPVHKMRRWVKQFYEPADSTAVAH